VLDEVALGLMMVGVVVHAWLASTASRRTTDAAQVLASTVSAIENRLEAFELPELDFNAVGDSVQAEISAVIEDVLGQMHVPTAADHMFGMLSTFLQARLMDKMGPEHLAATLGLAGGDPEAQPESGS